MRPLRKEDHVSNRAPKEAEQGSMKNMIAAVALVLSSCASGQQPDACPKCYAIDEVAPYEPPNRVVILCADPPVSDAGPDAVVVDDETGPVRF